MQRISITTAALITIVLLLATACSATGEVTVLESARATGIAPNEAEPTASSAQVEAVPRDAAPDQAESEPAQADPATPAQGEPDEAPTASGTAIDQSTNCTYLGVDTFDDMQIELRLINTLDTQADAIVSYSVVAGDGSTLTESTTFLEDVLPGESVRMDVDTVTDAPADDSGVQCTIDGVASADFGDDDGLFRATPQDTCAFVEVDFADDAQLTMTVTNPTDKQAELSVDYALRSAEGVRFNDGVTFFDALEPGESITRGVDTFDDLPAWIDPDEISCEILAIVGY